MVHDEKISRRRALRISLAVLPLAAAGATILNACGSGPDCTDISGLSAPEAATRTALEYVEASPHGAEKNCVNCNLYTGNPTQCGACTVVKGPVNPLGYCKSWVIKA